jgi:isocitrate dehydrogenase kinase/phosphatase
VTTEYHATPTCRWTCGSRSSCTTSACWWNHHQPELAETFFNSVCTKLLHRSYFRNDFLFVRPAVSTEYIENDEPAATPTYRAYYPEREACATRCRASSPTSSSGALRGPGRATSPTWHAAVDAPAGRRALRTNFQIQVLSSLFFRNKGAYVVGKIINGFRECRSRCPSCTVQRQRPW